MKFINHLLELKEPPKSCCEIENFDLWENYSFPIGNGFFGACLFGLINNERIQITENSFANPYANFTKDKYNAGLMNFCEINLRFNHNNIKEYKKELDIDHSIFKLDYSSKDIKYHREAFATYVDKVIAIKLTSNKKESISLNLECSLPYVRDYCSVKEDKFKRDGTIKVNDDSISFSGKLYEYNIDYVGIIKVVIKDGEIIKKNNYLEINNSSEVIIYFSCMTNYKLSPDIFLNDDNKTKLKRDPNLFNKVNKRITDAIDIGYKQLYERHLEDYTNLFNRVEISLNNEDKSDVPTSKLLSDYKEGVRSSYLESLLYQYGRYLLICSSRPLGLPCNLQGIWTPYASSPWSAGYWHNINVQMNYWAAFPSNLTETFIPYDKYNECYYPKACLLADDYIDKSDNVMFEKGENGWIIGTGAWPYKIEGIKHHSHSGPGTGVLTSLLFYDYYSYTLDNDYLKNRAYPLLYNMSLFLSKCLTYDDGAYLIKDSASPENIIKGGEWNDYYITRGCAFDQQMVYENFKRTLELHSLLKLEDDKLIKFIKKVINKLHPVLIGLDNQIKEYREEKHYADIGEEHHRHISHLVGLYPGSIINDSNPDWINSAINTLNYRGDKSTGWALMHRLCCWSRTHKSDRAYDIIKSLINNNLFLNLWDKHPPFQIDGNFGYVAGVSEMLVSTHNGYIELLPCLPKEWENGYFKGLLTRGAFIVDTEYENNKIKSAVITAKKDNILNLKINDMSMLYLNDKVLYKKCNGIVNISLKKNDRIYLVKL